MFTIVGLLLAIFAICKMDHTAPVIEGYWGSRGVKAVNYVKGPDGSPRAVGDYITLNPTLGNDQFVSTANFQSLLSPRMYGGGMPAHIKYNMPDYKNQAIPCNPLGYADMAKEGYQAPVKENYRAASCSGCGGGCGTPSCGGDGTSLSVGPMAGDALPGDYAPGNYNELVAQVEASNNAPTYNSDLPVGKMTTMGADGNVENPIIYQRLMYARPQGKLRQYGDPIRGDLAIVPCGGEWFSVHPNINLDLQEGAMNVMGGVRNETNNSLAELINRASGGADTTIGGVDLAGYNPATQSQVGLSGAFGDVTVSAYP